MSFHRDPHEPRFPGDTISLDMDGPSIFSPLDGLHLLTLTDHVSSDALKAFLALEASHAHYYYAQPDQEPSDD